MSEFDKFGEMLAAQRSFQESLGYDFKSMSTETKIDFMKDMKLAIDSELQEMMDEIGWKPWATSRHINREAVVAEAVDAWHFFMNFLLVMDVDSDEFHKLYHQKLAKNYVRQREGYDGVAGKCPSCKRAYDDDAVLCHPTHYSQLQGHVAGWCNVNQVEIA